MKNFIQEDVELFVSTFDLADQLAEKKILVTGATGLIGSTLVRCILALNKCVKIVCPVRSSEKARKIFNCAEKKLRFVESDLLEFTKDIKEHFDFIIHCACPTAGTFMLQHPVETYEFAVMSTKNLLSYAKENQETRMVYISSLEYYGQIFDDRVITEDVVGFIDPCSARSCYPNGKRAAEYLCVSYALEFGVDVKIARLTQTFGAGIAKTDTRVFAQFARSVIMNEDIILHTTGDSAKPYCYTIDSVSAILYILLVGIRGEAYNVANPETYISVRNMAEFLRDNFNPNISVRIELHPEMGYAPVTKLNLSVEKLMLLGWKPYYDLKKMYERLIGFMKNEN